MGNGILGSFALEFQNDPYESPILSPLIKNFTPILLSDEELRGSFANFVASSVWLEEFVRQDKYVPEDYQSGRLKHTLDGLHMIDHLRYELPSGELFPSTSHFVTANIVDAVSAAEEQESNKKRFLHRQFHGRKRAMIDTHASLNSDSIQLVVCAGLMTAFIESPAFLEWSSQIHADEETSARYRHNLSIDKSAHKHSSLRESAGLIVANVAAAVLVGETDITTGKEDCVEVDEEKVVSIVTAEEVAATKPIPFVSAKVQKNNDNVIPDDEVDPLEDFDEAIAVTSYYETLLVQTVAKVDMLKLTDTLSSDLWLREVLRYLETLPVAISVSDARRNSSNNNNMTSNDITIYSNSISNSGRDSFPLIYVNRAYEKLTGYHRQEMLGRNCRFLQTEEHTERQQIERISTALQQGVSLKLALTNVKKDGSSFLNFLALKPVFSRDNQYAYVIGISYDLAMAKAASSTRGSRTMDVGDVINNTINNNSNNTNNDDTNNQGVGQWWPSHHDEHDRLIEDLEGIDALLRLIPMLLV